MLKIKISQGFTLAEVLITLGIIGVVAAMTIPTLVANYQEKTYNTAATTFERKLGEALKVMNSQQTLAGFSSTEDFVDELSKHFKITKTCSNNELLDCFEEEVLWGGGEATPESVEMSTIKTSKHFGQDTWEQTNIVGVQFASGVTALIAYNKDATQDPYSNQIITFSGSSNGRNGSVRLGTDSLAILYDTNGAKSPNQSAKDLRSINVSRLGNSGCFAEVNGTCFGAPFVATPHIWNACQSDGTSTDTEDQKFMSDYGISKCYNADDYWAGAVKSCGGSDKMASLANLTDLANYIYGRTDIVNGPNPYSDLTPVVSLSSLGFTSTMSYVWSNYEPTSSGLNVCGRLFTDTSTMGIYCTYETRGGGSSPWLTICLEDN